MKLSEILKDWPDKVDDLVTFDSSGDILDVKAFETGFNEGLTSCDREIDREALKRELIKKSFRDFSSSEPADFIISTMPTWLKRIEDK